MGQAARLPGKDTLTQVAARPPAGALVEWQEAAVQLSIDWLRRGRGPPLLPLNRVAGPVHRAGSWPAGEEADAQCRNLEPGLSLQEQWDSHGHQLA